MGGQQALCMIDSLKSRVLSLTDKGSIASIAAGVQGVAKECFAVWFGIVMEKRLQAALRPRPRPSVYRYRAEIEEARAQGERRIQEAMGILQAELLDKLAGIGVRHLDLDKYVDGK